VGEKLSPRELALYRATDEVLHYIWDPVGVAKAPEARDEYHAYLPRVFGMLREGRTVQDIAAYLTSVTRDRIGLDARSDHDIGVARLLIRWKEAVAARYA